MNIATFIIAITMVFALVMGLRAGRGRKIGLEGWSVGGRNFGPILVFILMAGEIYTTFTFLGASGYAYGKGAPAYYTLVYLTFTYLLAYWMLPAIWRYARSEGILSQAGFFARKYDSPALGLLVTCVGILALIPYLVLQLKGLGIIVSTASYGTLSPVLGATLGAIVMSLYVFVSGIHGPASIAIVKDVLILAIVIFLGLYLPFHLYGGVGPMFHAIDVAHPGFLIFPAKGQSVSWFESTVLLTACGFFMWPHSFGSIYTARDERSLRRNAVVSPLYGLMLLFVLFVGFAALMRVPGLTGKDIDLALFKIALAELPPVVIGIIGAAGVLTALVPGSMMLMAASTTLAKDIYPLARRKTDERETAIAAKVFVPIVAAVALYFTLNGGDTIVALLLMGYSLVTQLLPSLLVSLGSRRVFSAEGAFAGICAGVAVVMFTTITKTSLATVAPGLPQWILDLNIGIVALALNVAAALAVTAAVRAMQTRRVASVA
ncbi:sodium:solute symporter [Beijerinckia sp. L45]|uniref:sodium:solute symporter family protein n=1 Tax=Beijerinckia sp. L45 TaxID=1641855 RepID=UPI00131EAC5E|nr:sodium:solute symporter [Beijerinckia sp. L45]